MNLNIAWVTQTHAHMSTTNGAGLWIDIIGHVVKHVFKLNDESHTADCALRVLIARRKV